MTIREYDEIQMRISYEMEIIKMKSTDLVWKLPFEILTGPSGVTGFAGGRPKYKLKSMAYWPAVR